jgi:hypothetical protein
LKELAGTELRGMINGSHTRTVDHPQLEKSSRSKKKEKNTRY